MIWTANQEKRLYNTLALPVLLYGSKTWTFKARDARRITAAEMKYVRRTTGYTWTDYKTNCKGVKNYTNYTSDWNTKEDGYNMEIECLKIDYPGY